ncbi:enoyl-CoA hydratase/isomerase family protein [Novilysobacter defluvii]|uniref:Enoyl-CoA hydratase n=1 Tax=Lysobacter defluvii IMMIB APB-9 = DSM 18482 TaxID=1385515 RepID=A0A0A0MAG7_9GAMM|nr:enoyl-CoA hydratase/isomerase family protein [Lysobacter defluvii]KGO98201.1 enoyl-CoA hydratase [Lysobacter defluvii IMMIB APB-9 = DSM 18482]
MSLVQSIEHGEIVELKLSRPPVNALNPELCRDLRTAVDSAVSNGAGGLVLSGGEKVFSAGLDVPYLLSLGADRQALSEAWLAFVGAARALAGCAVPVAAALGGHSPAGGCVMALCCDYRVMAEGEFRIGLNETQVGLVAPEGIQRLMRRVVGPQRAERLLVAGEMVAPAEALRIGLVDELAPAADVTARALARIQALLALPREPMLQTRRLARADVEAALAPEHIELERFIESWYLPGTQAGLKALVARLGK